MTIQVDMFEVQLGAGMLLQFRSESDTVRVLADAGVHAKGYRKDHVHSKLPGAFAALGDEQLRLDLIIGTHYDADHLLGLPAIIADPRYSIGEIWLPPVANDAQAHAFDVRPDDGQLLPLQLKADETGRVLSGYLEAKAAICASVRALEHDAVGDLKAALFSARLSERPRDEPAAWRRYFVEHIEEASRLTGAESHSHGDEPLSDDDDSWLEGDHPESRFSFFRTESRLKSAWAEDTELAFANSMSLAHIRKRAAEDAISALALNEVVTAAKARDVLIRCSIIPNGEPRRFIWRKTERRFEPNEVEAADGPELILLGPSEGLVSKHWNKLPLGSYLAKLAFVPVPLKGITASNQLSYVCVFKADNQKILISGDAGFVDFKPKPKSPCFPKLIRELEGLDVIQVAHHGGYNHSFYNGLLEARGSGGARKTYLLLSHAVHDKSRPSHAFGLYIAQVRSAENGPVLLFTSEPQVSKVKDYEALIAAATGSRGPVGDVRLRHSEQGWEVLAHAIGLS